ncbi:hypothetical protein [Rhodobacter maris]|uniref:Uncharacterized protein n=1 Tax=Rhodobacter maris TaxID=446682 RepID=A0A285TD85_9RHOB|nr:hypothetical protein [Rhodobacter maris]SOC19601.1 hypothetical protein SAMN05877831_11820 [Rhodobacter maris]
MIRSPERLTNDELMTRAARGLGKIDQHGPRGVTLVSFEEIEAMAGLLACLGLVPIYPGYAPKTHFLTTYTKDRTDV